MAITLDGTNGVTTPDLTVDTDTLTVNPTNNRVGIGTASPPQKFVVSNAGADNIVMAENSSASIQMFMQAQSGVGAVGTLTNHDTVFLANNSEKGRFLAGGGLTFNGDTAAANALNDYEEGTWTPSPSSGSLQTFLNQWYTKIGNIVTCSFYMYNFSGGTSNAQVIISGLPFAFKTSSEGFFQVGFVGGTNSLPTNTISITARIGQNGSNSFGLFLGKVGNAYSNMQYSELGTGHYVATFSYQTA